MDSNKFPASFCKSRMDVFKGDELNKYNRHWKRSMEGIVNQEKLYLTNQNKLDFKSPGRRSDDALGQGSEKGQKKPAMNMARLHKKLLD